MGMSVGLGVLPLLTVVRRLAVQLESVRAEDKMDNVAFLAPAIRSSRRLFAPTCAVAVERHLCRIFAFLRRNDEVTGRRLRSCARNGNHVELHLGVAAGKFRALRAVHGDLGEGFMMTLPERFEISRSRNCLADAIEIRRRSSVEIDATGISAGTVFLERFTGWRPRRAVRIAHDRVDPDEPGTVERRCEN